MKLQPLQPLCSFLTGEKQVRYFTRRKYFNVAFMGDFEDVVWQPQALNVECKLDFKHFMLRGLSMECFSRPLFGITTVYSVASVQAERQMDGWIDRDAER